MENYIIDIVCFVLVPVLFLLCVMLRKWTQSIGYSVCLFPASAVSTEVLGRLLVGYSIWPYILFVFTWIGMCLLFYNYKTDYYYTVGQFFKKYLSVISVCTLIVWVAVSIVRLFILVV